MTEGDDGCSGAELEGRPSASLHTLEIKTAALKRLLNQRDPDGALVPADRRLIEIAIAAISAELTGVRGLLANLPRDPVGPYHGATEAMAQAVADLDGMLDAIERSMPTA